MIGKPGGRRVSKSRRIVFAAVALVMALFAAEGLARIFLPPIDWEKFIHSLGQGTYARWDNGYVLQYRFDQDYNFRLAPGRFPLAGGGFREINELGLPGTLPPGHKADGSLRVLVLGGSFSFQFNHTTGKAWPDLVGERLTARLGFPVEIINASTPGYTTYQSAERLRSELLWFWPDVVLITHLWNDLKYFALDDPMEPIRYFDAVANQDGNISALGINPLLDILCRYSRMAAGLNVRSIRTKLSRARALQEGAAYQSTDHEIAQAGRAFYRDNLARMVQQTKDQGALPIIVLQPTLVRPDNTPEERERIKYKFVGFSHETLVEAYQNAWDIEREVCAKMGAPCLEAEAAIPADLGHFSDHVHLTNAGRESMADFITESFLALGDTIRNRAEEARPAPPNPE